MAIPIVARWLVRFIVTVPRAPTTTGTTANSVRRSWYFSTFSLSLSSNIRIHDLRYYLCLPLSWSPEEAARVSSLFFSWFNWTGQYYHRGGWKRLGHPLRIWHLVGVTVKLLTPDKLWNNTIINKKKLTLVNYLHTWRVNMGENYTALFISIISLHLLFQDGECTDKSRNLL